MAWLGIRLIIAIYRWTMHQLGGCLIGSQPYRDPDNPTTWWSTACPLCRKKTRRDH